MKLVQRFGVFFALWMCLESKEIRQISRLIPLEDWLAFKNHTRGVKPLDKFIGKLRATYDFVFHKADNVSGVEKILDRAKEDDSPVNVTTTNSHISFIERRKSGEAGIATSDEKIREERNETSRMLENPTDALVLERLEILDDESSDSFESDDERLEKEHLPPHSKFAIPYAIAEAFIRWIISLYLSTSNHFASIDSASKDGARE